MTLADAVAVDVVGGRRLDGRVATYVAFLRAINLGARRKFDKASIVSVTGAAGFSDVATHINTGNVRLTTRLRSRERVRDVLEEAYLADRGFEVPVSVLTPEELRQALADGQQLLAEMPAGWDGRAYASLLRDEPTPDGIAALEALSTEDERAVVRGRVAHLAVRGYGTSRMTNAPVEKHLGTATNRALSVLEQVVAKWC